MCGQVMVLWLVAYVLVSHDFGTATQNAHASDSGAALLLLGCVWWLAKQAWRTVTQMSVGTGALPLERSIVCANNGFILHRNNEFMFLMLGETVLQIVIGVSDDLAFESSRESFFNTKAVTATAGFVLAGCMMLSFRAMVAGQLLTYQRTNRGLTKEVEDADSFLKCVRTSMSGPSGSGAAGPAQAPALADLSQPAVRRPQQPGQARQQQLGSRDIPSHRIVIDASLQPHCNGGGAAIDVVPRPMVAQRTRYMSTIAARPGALKKMIDTKAFSRKAVPRAQLVLLKMRLYNTLNTFLWELKAVAIMLVGVGVKLAIYDPTASAHARFALEQRLELGVPAAVVFFVQIFHAVMIKNRHHYSRDALLEQWVHTCVVLSRLVLLAAAVALCFVPMRPLGFLWAQAALAMLQCVLSHLQDFKVPIKSPHSHPMSAMPQALSALYQQRVRERDNDEAADMLMERALIHGPSEDALEA